MYNPDDYEAVAGYALDDWYDARRLLRALLDGQKLGTALLSSRDEIKSAIEGALVANVFGPETRFRQGSYICRGIGYGSAFTKLFVGLNSKMRFFSDRDEGTASGSAADAETVQHTLMDATRALDMTIYNMIKSLSSDKNVLTRQRFEAEYHLTWTPAAHGPGVVQAPPAPPGGGGARPRQ